MHWKQLAKKVAYWTVPPGVQTLVRSHLERSRALSSEKLDTVEMAILEKNCELHNRHLGERCFILATGPSIKNQDLRPLQGEKSIAVSNFFVHQHYQIISPQYYCVAPLHPPYTDEDGIRWFRDMEENVGSVTMLLSYSDRQLIESNGLFRKQKVNYLYFDGRYGFDAPNSNLMNLAEPLPPPQTVTLIALSVALYLGFQTIYLLGCDHSWPLHIGKSAHFHDEQSRKLGPEHWNVLDYETFFLRFAGLLRKYKVMKSLAERQGCTIYNATPNSFIDVFEPVKFETLFTKER